MLTQNINQKNSGFSTFGALLKNNATTYRYGFNGMEKDDEVTSGEGQSYDFGARFYNPRVGRWLSRDPHEMKYTALSPYNFVANSPLRYIDPDGKDIVPVNDAAKVYFNDLLASYNVYDDDGELVMSGAELFGITKGKNGYGFSTTLRLNSKKFEKRLKKNGVTDKDDIEIAKGIYYNLLTTSDLEFIGFSDPASVNDQPRIPEYTEDRESLSDEEKNSTTQVPSGMFYLYVDIIKEQNIESLSGEFDIKALVNIRNSENYSEDNYIDDVFYVIAKDNVLYDPFHSIQDDHNLSTDGFFVVDGENFTLESLFKNIQSNMDMPGDNDKGIDKEVTERKAEDKAAKKQKKEKK